MTATPPSPASAEPRLGRIAQAGLLVGPLLSMIDSSIVNVAVPDVAKELKAHLDDVQWIVSGYLLALGVALALTAYLAKRFGTMRVYFVSMILFVLASAVCAIAPDIGTLIAARAAQGFVGAPLVPLALSVLLGKAGIGGGKVPVSAALILFLAPALGPTLGGLLIGAGGWRWIFLVNLPVGIIGLLLLSRTPASVGALANRLVKFDPFGFVLLAVGLTAALFGATQGTSDEWDSPWAWAPLAGGLVLLIAYVLWALRREHPAVDVQLVKHFDSGLALILQVLCSIVAFGTVFLVPVFTQSVQGHSAIDTGLALLPQGIVMGVGTWAGQKLMTRIPLRVMVVSGFVILAIASIYLMLIEPDTELWITAVLLCGRALAIGLVTAPLLIAMLAPLSDAELPDGNTLFNITQRLGGSIGVSILGSIVAGGMTLAAVVDDFHLVGLIMVIIAVVAGVLALWIRPVKQMDVTVTSLVE